MINRHSCATCAHHRHPFWGTESAFLCAHDKVICKDTGEQPKCVEMRITGAPCGPDGLLWEKG